MPLYTVRIELDIPAVVQAEDEDEAWDIARESLREIMRDVDIRREADIYVSQQIEKKEDLPEEWDERSVPYGGDGNTRLADLL